MHNVDIASFIDHAALKPEMTVEKVRAECLVAVTYEVASVCVRPADVMVAREVLTGSKVALSTVIGFPHGSIAGDIKAAEAGRALDDGAVELDMVLNFARLISGENKYVRDEIAGITSLAKPRGAMVKVILETCYLTPELIRTACQIAEEAGADYVKTSTGFGTAGATAEAVKIMLESVGGRLGVKASGGIRTAEQAVRFLEMGCKRLGTGSTQAIIAELNPTK